MSERQTDEHSGVETTGHEWDGIRELDNPLPRWWLWTFYACIVVAIGYWILMPAWPGLRGFTPGVLGQSDRASLANDLGALKAQRGVGEAKLASASLEAIEHDPELQALSQEIGQSVFADNCAGCHGAGAAGAKGYPNLRDDVWIWGGSLEEIYQTLVAGVRSGHANAQGAVIMPAFGRDQMLTAPQVADLVEYVTAVSGRPADAAAVARARQSFADNCAACHGADARGAVPGAPNLTDADWLYGGDKASLRAQIWNGQNGVMPSWEGRLSPETLKALAVYVHSNAGGEDAKDVAALRP